MLGRSKLFHVADEKTENLGDSLKDTHLFRNYIKEPLSPAFQCGTPLFTGSGWNSEASPWEHSHTHKWFSACSRQPCIIAEISLFKSSDQVALGTKWLISFLMQLLFLLTVTLFPAAFCSSLGILRANLENERANLVGALPLWTRHEKKDVFYNWSSSSSLLCEFLIWNSIYYANNNMRSIRKI